MTDPKLNQTQFGSEGPLFERPVSPSAISQPTENELMAEKPPKKLPLVFVIVGVVMVVLMAVILIFAILMRSAPPPPEEAELIMTEQTRNYGPLQQRLNDLKNELKAADPDQEELPFPPIDQNLSVEPLTR